MTNVSNLQWSGKSACQCLIAARLLAAPIKPIVPFQCTALTKSNHCAAITIFGLGKVICLSGKSESGEVHI